MIEVHQFACLSDNYGFLLHDAASGETACIDTPDAEAYLREAAAKGWRITQIWNTHWHPDHAGGNAAIKARQLHEEKEAVEQYGSSDSGASLGDILGAALKAKND